MVPRTPICDRLCMTCNDVEDKIYILVYCKLHEENRNIFYQKVARRNFDFMDLQTTRNIFSDNSRWFTYGQVSQEIPILKVQFENCSNAFICLKSFCLYLVELELEYELEKDLVGKIHFCTKYNNSRSRLLIRQETLIKVHMHRLHGGHQRSKQVYHAVSLSSLSVFTCIKIWRWIRSHGTNEFLKRYLELTGPVDNCQQFRKLFVVWKGLHAELYMYMQ